MRNLSTTAKEYLEARKPNIVFIPDAAGKGGAWFVFNGEVWVQDTTAGVLRDIRAWATARRDKVSSKEDARYWDGILSKRLFDVATYVSLDCTKPWPAFDANPNVLPMADKRTVDLATGTIRPSRPDDYATKSSNVAIPADANLDDEAAMWERMPTTRAWLNQAFQPEALDDLMNVLAYALSGGNTEKVLPVVVGPTDTGKSTLLKVMGRCWGDFIDTLEPAVFYRNSRVNPGNHFFRLSRRRIAVMSEASGQKEFDEELLKRVCGSGDKVTCERKYHQPFSEVPTWKLLLVCNEARLPWDDEALWNRVKVFEISGKLSAADHDAIIEEAPWFLAMLAGRAKRLHGKRLTFSTVTADATGKARNLALENQVGQAAIARGP